MAGPRKVFRIEQTAAARVGRGVDAASIPLQPVSVPLGSTAIAAAEPADGPSHDGETTSDLARIAHELRAVTDGTAQATQRILTAAEHIDQLADNLSAALKDRIEQDAAQDISDLVITIFEACNFQDLIAQRVGKVLKTLKFDDAPVPIDDAAPLLHGPRLDDDDGHMTQAEIDALFGF